MLALKLNKQKKKKVGEKKKVKKFKGSGLRIVDEDAFGFGYKGNNESDDSDHKEAEELPQIAAVVDERPAEVQMLEEFQKGKWKQIGATSLDSNFFGRTRHDSDEDGHQSISKRIRHDSDGDVSPPLNSGRRKRHDSDGDLSPPRRRHDSDGSQPSVSRIKREKEDICPPRRKKHDSGDMSPPRRKKHNSGDMSPARRKRRDSGDISPPRRCKKDSGDLSPPRHRGRKFDDRSPPRRNDGRSQGSRRIAVPEIIDAPSNIGTTLEGKRAGLQRASDLRKEMVDFRRKENEMFSNLDDEVSGRTAKTKLRDKRTGRERDLGAELVKKEEENRLAAEKKKQYDKWSKGLKQVEEQSTRINEALHEVDKPLARYANDQDLDVYLKQQDRDGDPMLKFMSKKSKIGSDKPRYNGPPPPPNRFGIAPGYRWDGVDRSSGYEAEWFARINTKKAIQEEAYKWSVEDL